MRSLAMVACLALTSRPAAAWYERGHDVVTRVAAHLLEARTAPSTRLSRPFTFRQDMLGHIANVPDTQWRRGDPKQVRANAATHATFLDDLADRPSLATIPVALSDAHRRARARGHDLATETGTAIWRVAQLATLLEQELAGLARRQRVGLDRDALHATVERALVWAGLLSHFVADLANPHHTCRDTDGWQTGQGGLHAYFESSLVDAQRLDLAQAVFDHAQRQRPAERLVAGLASSPKSPGRIDYARLALALAVDSFARRSELLRLDREHALLVASEAPRVAQRRPARQVAAAFRAFLVERLALAADLLTYLWSAAYERAGEPDMSSFTSMRYATTPAFVWPTYLETLNP